MNGKPHHLTYVVASDNTKALGALPGSTIIVVKTPAQRKSYVQYLIKKGVPVAFITKDTETEGKHDITELQDGYLESIPESSFTPPPSPEAICSGYKPPSLFASNDELSS